MKLTSPNLPPALNAGDSINFTYHSVLYPANAGWVMIFKLRKKDGSIDISSTAEAETHFLNVTFAQSEAWDAGVYAYRCQMIKNDSAITIGDGSVRINPSFTGNVDPRSQAEKSLEKLEILLSGKAESGIYEYEIAGRRLKSYKMDELIWLRKDLRAQIAREKAEQGIKTPQTGGRIKVRFGN